MRLTISRPAVFAGLRAATATVLPLVVGELTGQRAFQWTALGGWLASLVDAGGAYRSRARVMTAYALAGSAAAAVATLVGGDAWAATLVALLVAWGGAMLRVYGDAGSSLGVLVTVVFCAALGGTEHTPAAALLTVGLFGLGALAAMALALVVWPVWPYAPARAAVANVYHALAGFARDIARVDRAAATGADHWQALASRAHAPVRVALEDARSVLAEARARRPGASERADQLLRLYDRAEQLFALIAAVAEELAAAPPTSSAAGGSSATTRAGDVLLALADTLDATAAVLTAGHRRQPAAQTTAALDAALLQLWEEAEDDLAIVAGGASSECTARAFPLAHGSALLEEVATEAQMAEQRARGVRSGERLRDDDDARTSAERVVEALPRLPGLLPIRANLTPRSIVFRHAVRLALVVALAVAVTTLLGVTHGEWIVITALVVLQPYPGLTAERGVQRVLGTVGGGVVAALLAVVLRSPLAIAAAMFPLSVAAIALRPVHYGAFTFFLTPVFVLMAGEATGDWRLAGLRALGTAAGGALALVASRMLWPSWQSHGLPQQLASALEASRQYLQATVQLAGWTEAERARALTDARRRLGLAGNNAEATLQRSLGEPYGRWADVEAPMAFLAHLRRLNGAITVLAVAPAAPTPPAEALDAVLAGLVDAVREGRPPPPLSPDFAMGSAPASGAAASNALASGAPAALDRVLRQVQRMHAATAALAGASAAEHGVAAD